MKQHKSKDQSLEKCFLSQTRVVLVLRSAKWASLHLSQARESRLLPPLSIAVCSCSTEIAWIGNLRTSVTQQGHCLEGCPPLGENYSEPTFLKKKKQWSWIFMSSLQVCVPKNHRHISHLQHQDRKERRETTAVSVPSVPVTEIKWDWIQVNSIWEDLQAIYFLGWFFLLI